MRRLLIALAVTGLAAMISSRSLGEQRTGWRVSPENINIQAGASRTLQILDDNAQELRGALWSVDQSELAEIREENGRATVHAKAPGTILVSALRSGETRTMRIRIWAAGEPLPPGTTAWGTHPIGRQLGDVPAAPNGGSVTTFSLEQTAAGSTYLRGVTGDGIQEWAWLMPEKTRNVELICGDWLGGALIGADRGGSFALYSVSNEGELRWQRAFAGRRKAHAYNREHLLHIGTQSPDGAEATIFGLDGRSGEQRFALLVPATHVHLKNLSRESGFVCAASPAAPSVRAAVSDVFVSPDGHAYAAFAHGNWTLSTGACARGASIDPDAIALAGEQRLSLWQIQPDGTRRETIVESIEAGASPPPALTPTGEIIPDGLGGVLLSVRRNPDARDERPGAFQEFIYRVDHEGKLVWRMPLPAYEGALKDAMVLGDNNLGFATRGPILVAFDVSAGKELWRWDSHVDGIEVFAALADGTLLVQTPTALVQVMDTNTAREVMKGKAMMGWNGQIYRQHQ